nr:GAF domain-containing protein [Desulfobulbaceae bacterium]
MNLGLPNFTNFIIPLLASVFFIVSIFLYRRHKRQDNILYQRKKISEEALDYKAGLERILNSISLALMDAGSEKQFNRVVNTMLGQVGEYVCVDRLYIFLFSADNKNLTNTHEWCAPGITAKKNNHQKLPPESIPWIISSLNQNDHILLPDAGDLPIEALQEAAMFKRGGNHTMMMVPIRARNALMGFIGFDFLEQPWMDEDINLLQSLSNILGSAIYRIRAENKLLERGETLMKYQARLKSLVIELTLAEERERRKVANDLHDQIGQMLAVVKIKQKKLVGCVDATDSKALSNEIIEMLDQVLADVRSLTFDLSALAVHRDDIDAAIESLGNRLLTGHGINSSFQTTGSPYALPEHIQTILYQVIRELYYNIIKHAHAKNVEVTVSWYPNKIDIMVTDDGVGFDTNQLEHDARAGHFGLFNVQERISSLSGVFHTFSAPGSGTTTEISIPLTKSKNRTESQAELHQPLSKTHNSIKYG